MQLVGVASFFICAFGFLIMSKHAIKIKKENNQLHKDLEFVLQHVPVSSVKEIEELKQEYLMEDKK